MAALFVCVVLIIMICHAIIFAQEPRRDNKMVTPAVTHVVIKDSSDLVRERQKTQADSIRAITVIRNTRDDIMDAINAKNDTLAMYRAMVGSMSIGYY